MQIKKPAATNEKNLTTDVNLEFIIKTSSEAEFCYYYALRILKARELKNSQFNPAGIFQKQ